MKTIINAVIERGTYDLRDILAKINRYHIEGAIDDAEREELTALAREKANARESVDIFAKLEELDRRVAALEAKSASDGSGSDVQSPDGGETSGGTLPAYTVGKWYYKGDKVTFGGRAYECSAPDGVVCTWSPEDYPAYWTVLE